jgi:hypothetical protein
MEAPTRRRRCCGGRPSRASSCGTPPPGDDRERKGDRGQAAAAELDDAPAPDAAAPRPPHIEDEGAGPASRRLVPLPAQEPNFTAINATIEVDLLGQCTSEGLGSDYWSSSGGQPDFARGAVLFEGGQAFIVLHSTTGDEEAALIVPALHPGAAVATFENTVDRVVTGYLR